MTRHCSIGFHTEKMHSDSSDLTEQSGTSQDQGLGENGDTALSSRNGALFQDGGGSIQTPEVLCCR